MEAKNLQNRNQLLFNKFKEFNIAPDVDSLTDILKKFNIEQTADRLDACENFFLNLSSMESNDIKKSFMDNFSVQLSKIKLNTELKNTQDLLDCILNLNQSEFIELLSNWKKI